jgi:ATP-dependent Zn protease
MPRPRRQSTAFHEAGHAVIARVLTLAAGGATIKADYTEGSAGHTITLDPYACLDEWEKRGKVRDQADAVWHARIMAYMAGAEAEAVLLDRKAIGDGYDRREIARMAGELCYSAPWDTLEPRLRTMTRMLVRRHKARIERVAKALLAKTTLSAKQVDKLVGRSVDDVKVNAPFLLRLAMHQVPKP